MGLDAAFTMLEGRLHALQEALTGLRTTIVEDRPLRAGASREDTPALVDILGDGADNLAGCALEAGAALRDSRQAALHGDMDGMRRALAACHTQAGAIAQQLFAELATYERIADLARVGRTRGGEWRAWAAGVKQALDTCRQPLFDVQHALMECWLEVAERSSRPTIAIHTAGMGQQLAPGDARQPVAG